MTSSAPTSRATSQNSYTNLVLLLASNLSNKQLEELTRTLFGAPGSVLRSQFRQDNAQDIVDMAVRDHKIKALLDLCRPQFVNGSCPSQSDCQDIERFRPVSKAGSNSTPHVSEKLPLDRVYLEDLKSSPSKRAMGELKNSGLHLSIYCLLTILSLLPLWPYLSKGYATTASVGSNDSICLFVVLLIPFIPILAACYTCQQRIKWRQVCKKSGGKGTVLTGWKKREFWEMKEKYYFAFRFYTSKTDVPYDVFQDIDQEQYSRMYIGEPVDVGCMANDPLTCRAFFDGQDTKQP